MTFRQAAVSDRTPHPPGDTSHAAHPRAQPPAVLLTHTAVEPLDEADCPAGDQDEAEQQQQETSRLYCTCNAHVQQTTNCRTTHVESHKAYTLCFTGSALAGIQEHTANTAMNLTMPSYLSIIQQLPMCKTTIKPAIPFSSTSLSPLWMLPAVDTHQEPHIPQTHPAPAAALS